MSGVGPGSSGAAGMGGTAELPFLVERLNAPPFGFDETVVTLSEKVQSGATAGGDTGQDGGIAGAEMGVSGTPLPVHQLLTDIFACVSPETHARVDVSTETLEETLARIAAFLRQIKYRTDEDEYVLEHNTKLSVPR